jgi:uncharacterized membrane protein
MHLCFPDIVTAVPSGATPAFVGNLAPAAFTLWLHFSGDIATNLQLLLRWVHFLAGITWVGIGYFLVLAGIPWQRELTPELRSRVAPPLMRRAWWWFRWASVVTVLAGLWIWMMEVGIDRRVAGQPRSSAIWSFFVLWTVAYLIYMGVMMSPAEALRKGPVLAIITAILVIAASYAFLRINSHGWESNRMLSIGIGGGIGWFMMFNLWGLVWRLQKRLMEWTAAGQMPPEAPHMQRLAILGAKTNAWLSLPMLFFMATASHYPLFG